MYSFNSPAGDGSTRGDHVRDVIPPQTWQAQPFSGFRRMRPVITRQAVDNPAFAETRLSPDAVFVVEYGDGVPGVGGRGHDGGGSRYWFVSRG